MIDPLWIGIVGSVILLVLLFGGVYVGVALGLVGTLGIIAIIGFSPAMSLLATTWFHYGTNYVFIVIPLFVAMGLFSAQADISRNSYDTLSKWLGQIRGGLGLATVGACTIFGALTGSSIVTAIVFAKISVPEMRRLGYNARISYGLVSAAGAIGMLIPPSVLAVIYAIITGQSVGALLLGGIGAGLVLAFCLGSGFVILLTLRPSLGPTASTVRITWKERFVSLPQLWPAFVVATIIIGGIYGGIFTVTEAAGVGSFATLILLLAIKGFSRESVKNIFEVLRDTISLSGMVLLILMTAQIYSRFLVLSGVGPSLANFIISLNLQPIWFVIGVSILFLFLGALIDAVSILAITIPLFYPVVVAMNIDVIWFAIVMILSTQIGTITPPVGLVIYAVKGVAEPDISLEDILRGVTPFFVMMLVALAIVIAFPVITTWIPYNVMSR